MGKRFDEDEKRNNGYKIIRKERERRYNQSDDEETISKGDL